MSIVGQPPTFAGEADYPRTKTSVCHFMLPNEA